MNSIIDYVATEGQVTFTVPFSYLDQSHIYVYQNSTDITEFVAFNSPSEITLTSNDEDVPAPTIHADDVVRVQRITPSDEPIVDFTNGSSLGESDLDTQGLQTLYLAQESQDLNAGALTWTEDGEDYDAEGRRIKNLGAPEAASDAANRDYVDDTWASILPAISAAQASAVAAVNAAEAASIADVNAAEAASIADVQAAEAVSIGNIQAAEAISIGNVQAAESASVVAVEAAEDISVAAVEAAESAGVAAVEGAEAAGVAAVEAAEAAGIAAIGVAESDAIADINALRSSPISGATITVKDTELTITDDGDATKKIQFNASAVTAGQTRTLSAPNASTTLVGTDTTQELTNKTVTSPAISSPTLSGTAIGTYTLGGTPTFSVEVDNSATSAFKLPVGTTAQRPTGATGKVRFNSSLTQFEGYNGTAWDKIGGGATGYPGNAIFYENDQAVTGDYSITSGKNAMSAGPITINNGITVTVTSGSTWTIV